MLHRRSARPDGATGAMFPPVSVWLPIALLAFLARLLPTLHGGGLGGIDDYDEGVYFAGAQALTAGRLPYRDFVLLHPPGILLLLVRWTFAFLKIALIVRVVVSWLPRLAYSRWLSWSFGATDWMLRPLRRVVPSLGVIDITPIVAYFGLVIVEWLVMSVLLAGFA